MSPSHWHRSRRACVVLGLSFSTRPSLQKPSADGPIVGQQGLSRGLYSRDGTLLGLGYLDQLLCTASLFATDVEVIAHQVKKGIIADKIFGAIDGVTVT